MILITGATGHVGNTLVHDLAKNKIPIRVFLPPNESILPLDGIQCELFCGDISNDEDVLRAVEGCDYVYHLAGLIDLMPSHRRRLERVNVQGTQNIVNACLRCRVKRLVYISSVHALPEPDKGQTLTELDASAFPNFTLHGPYAITKSQATAAIYNGIRQGLDAVIIFPSGIIGPFDFKDSQMGKVLRKLLCKKNLQHLRIFRGGYNFVDVRDVAKALQLAMEKGRSGEGYIIAGHHLTLKDLFAQVALWKGITEPKFTNYPLFLVKSAAKVVEKFASWFRRKPAFTAYSIDVLNSNAAMSTQKAVRELGFKPRALDDTLKATFHWLQTHTRTLSKKKTKRAARSKH